MNACRNQHFHGSLPGHRRHHETKKWLHGAPLRLPALCGCGGEPADFQDERCLSTLLGGRVGQGAGYCLGSWKSAQFAVLIVVLLGGANAKCVSCRPFRGCDLVAILWRFVRISANANTFPQNFPSVPPCSTSKSSLDTPSNNVNAACLRMQVCTRRPQQQSPREVYKSSLEAEPLHKPDIRNS